MPEVRTPESIPDRTPAAAVIRFPALDAVCIAACVLTLVLVLFGWLLKPHASLITADAISPLDPAAPTITGTGFRRDAVYPVTPVPAMDTSAERYGSWLGSDASVGQVESRWYRAAPSVSVLVAGYPDGQSKQLFLQGSNSQGVREQIAITPAQPPKENWVPVTINVPLAWNRFRIIAVDHSPGLQGWLGFSEPVRIQQSLGEMAKQYFLLILSTAASFVLILGPGLVVCGRTLRTGAGPVSLAFLPLPGLLAVVAIGLFAWKGPSFWSPVAVALTGTGLVALVFLGSLIRSRVQPLFSAAERKMILIVVLLAVIAISKATYSLGPVGELYGGEISRTLEVGGLSDSRINYHIVQMVAIRDHAFGPVIKRLLGPWNFSHRGPIAGLAASVVVLATPSKILTDFPDTPWQIFDQQGFAAYRVAVIVMSCCMLVPVFGLMRKFLAELPALLTFLVVVGSPFIIHELYFTWPKIIAAGLVMLSACMAWDRRYFASGLLLGLAYLTHPSALLAGPGLFALVLLRLPSSHQVLAQWKRVCLGWVAQALGTGIFLLFWKLVNGRHYTQDGFLIYLTMAEGRPPTFANWVAVRWLSLLNTLVPLHLFLFDSHSPTITFTSAIAPPVVTFFFQVWTSLPSGAGLLLSPLLLYWLFLGWRRARPWLVFIVILPFVFFSLYWGSFSTGLLRCGLHSWVIGTLCFGTWCWLTYGGRSRALWRLTSYILLLRGIETICMLLLPAIATNNQIVSQQLALSDTFMLVVLFIACGSLYWLTFRLSESLSPALDRATEMVPLTAGT